MAQITDIIKYDGITVRLSGNIPVKISTTMKQNAINVFGIDEHLTIFSESIQSSLIRW